MSKFSKRIISIALPFFSAWLAAFVLASIFHSVFVLRGLTQINIKIAHSDALSMITGDLLGLLPTYGAIIAIGLSLAFVFTRYVIVKSEHRNLRNILLYTLSGALAFLVMLSAMQPVLNVTLIAGARTCLGVLAQCLAGAMGGALFAKLKQ